MSDRHTADTITDDALDQLYAQLDELHQEIAAAGTALADMARKRNEQMDRADRAEADRKTLGQTALGYQQRAWDAEAAIRRVQHVAALIHAGAPWTANRHNTAARIRAAIAGPGTATAEETVPRALFDENARRHQAAVDRVDELLAAIARVRKVATAIRDATATGRNDWQIGQHDCALTILAALTEPAPAATEATDHRYLSTGCLHGHHDYCQNHTGHSGTKTPAQCKFCAAPCICPCHRGNAAVLEEQ